MQRPVVQVENTVVLSQHTLIFNYLIYKKHKRREKARNKKQKRQERFLKTELIKFCSVNKPKNCVNEKNIDNNNNK